MRVFVCFLLVIYSSIVNCGDDRMRCSKAMITGNCDEHIERYYYNKDEDSCKRFYYTGCNGNANNFETRDECKEACKGKGFCFFSPATGSCDEKITRYYYDSDSKKCKSFEYSGCGGNKNNFETKDECLKGCRVHFI